MLGATSHMGNNNRWAREGGVVDEIFVENTYRNPEGNPRDLRHHPAGKGDRGAEHHPAAQHRGLRGREGEAGQDRSRARLLQPELDHATRCRRRSSAMPRATASSASWPARPSAWAPSRATSSARSSRRARSTASCWATRSIFYSKDAGKPVRFFPPSYALNDITAIPRYREFNAREAGSRLWWIEYGGRLDTVHDTETIKWELWRVVYGVWNHVKNSGQFPEAENHDPRVGRDSSPASARAGASKATTSFASKTSSSSAGTTDAVSFGGWAIDLHPADGVFSEKPALQPVALPGHLPDPLPLPVQPQHREPVPRRTHHQRLPRGLWLHARAGDVRQLGAGRRHGRGDVHPGRAAAPRTSKRPTACATCRRKLMRAGQFVPGFCLDDPDDLAREAKISASSQLHPAEPRTRRSARAADPFLGADAAGRVQAARRA